MGEAWQHFNLALLRQRIGDRWPPALSSASPTAERRLRGGYRSRDFGLQSARGLSRSGPHISSAYAGVADDGHGCFSQVETPLLRPARADRWDALQLPPGRVLSDRYEDSIPPIDRWKVTVESEGEDYGEGEEFGKDAHVATIRLLRVRLGSGYDLLGALYDVDEYGGDLLQVGNAVLGNDRHNPTQRVSKWFPGPGNAMLIVDSFKFEPDWRGYGLEPLLAGLAIRKLSDGVKFVAVRLARSSLPRGKGRDVALAEMERPWRVLGFRHYRAAVWLSDPHAPSFVSTLDGLRSRFGVEKQIPPPE